MKHWLGWIVCSLCITTLFGVAPASAAPPPPALTAKPAPVVALRAARLFDGKSERLLQPAVVLVSGGKITAIGSNLKIPAGTEVFELGNTTLLPGFIDAHTHLTTEAGDNWYKDTVDGLRRSVPARTIALNSCDGQRADGALTPL